MKNIVYIYILTIITFFGYTSTSLAQEGSESAAEASVSGSASQPAVNPPDATDSNPIVTVVRAGIPVQQVLSGSISLTQVLSFAKSSGDMATLISGANLVSQGKDVSLVTDFLSATSKILPLLDQLSIWDLMLTRRRKLSNWNLLLTRRKMLSIKGLL